MSENELQLQAESLGLDMMGSWAKVKLKDSDPTLWVHYLWSIELYYFYTPLILCAACLKQLNGQECTRVALLYAIPNSDRFFEFQVPTPSYLTFTDQPEPVTQAISTLNVLWPAARPSVPDDPPFHVRLFTWTQDSESAFDCANDMRIEGLAELLQSILTLIEEIAGAYNDPKLNKILYDGPRLW
ncbi:MAG: hypothetical protein IPK19_28960 [Chloroflexi bacterium]|nr:hypothetical protein [Chloroflexota bacterium]